MASHSDSAQQDAAPDLEQAYQRWSAAAAAVLAKARRVTAEELPDSPEALLSTDTRDGVRVRPLYTRRDETGDRAVPGAFPYVRGADGVRDVTVGWRVTERFGDATTASPAELNAQIKDALEVGTSGLWLKLGDGIGTGDLAAVLDGVYLDLIPVTLDAGAQAPAAAEAFAALCAGAQAAPQAAASTAATVHSLGLNPLIDELVGRETVTAAQAAELAAKPVDGVRAYRIDGTGLAQAGADNAQEIGLVVAAGLAAVRDLVAAGLTVQQALDQLTFAVAVGDDQFAGIAKLRALRLAWARVAEVLGAPEAGAAIIHAVTDLSMYTQRDPWVNMLRTTVAAFAAGVGGADQVTTYGFDAAIEPVARKNSENFSRRIARNTQLLLLEESNIGRVLDPAGGSWYVESLTDDLAAAAWSVFTGIESAGGFAAAAADGKVTELLDEALRRRVVDVAHRTAPITGVSEFPNLAEPAPESAAATTALPGATTGLQRIALPFELLRDRADALAAGGDRPTALLISLGSVAEHNARTTFVANLLAAGGIAAANPGPQTADAVAATLADQPSPVVIVCGTKARYEQDGPAVLAALREAGAGRILLAGPEKEWPDGPDRPDGSLRVGIDAVATLTELLDLFDPAEVNS